MTQVKFTTPPGSEEELLDRAARLAGKTLQQLSGIIEITVPLNQKQAKGWIGEAMEMYLGATAATLPEPDFQKIGVELKTIPVTRHHRPKESTYVCTVQLTNLTDLNWENSTVKKKLNRVLWVPVEADSSIPFPTRRIGNAFLWSPDPEQLVDLRTDWQEIMDMISTGELNIVTSDYGKVLQVRPKGMNSKALTKARTETGEPGMTLPRGFYLRSSFTRQILMNGAK